MLTAGSGIRPPIAHPFALYILRHGETVWNVQGRLQGSLDSPLTERGLAQARAQRTILAECDLTGATAHCSPQGRALETARIALRGLLAPVHEDARLAEIGVGDWTGLRRDQIRIDRPLDESDESALDLYERAPGGEGFAALRQRCRAFLRDLDAPAVIVTHGITSRMLRLVALNLDISEIGQLEGGQGVVYHVADGVQTRLE